MASPRDMFMGTPPLGTTSNSINPESLGPLMLDLSVTVIVLTSFSVLIRLYSNYNATRGLGWDDLFCVMGTLLLFLDTGMFLSIRKWASHDYDIPVSTVTSLKVKVVFVISASTGPMMFFAKTSIFLLYYRVFTPNKFLRYIISVGIAFCFAVYLAYLAVAVYYCAPHPDKAWDLLVLYSCSRIRYYQIISGVANLALDIFMIGLPIPVILRLQLPLKKKIGVLAIFMTGLLVFIASTLTLVYKVKLFNSTDPIWNGFKLNICEIVETGITIICSSMPAIGSISKAWTVHSRNFKSFRSYLPSRFTLPSYKGKTSSSASSETHTDPFRAIQFNTKHHTQQNVFFGFGEHRESNKYPLNKTTTEVRGGACTEDIDDGIIKKSVTVLQSRT